MAELLITFRETLEAALIVGILYTFVSKKVFIKKPQKNCFICDII